MRISAALLASFLMALGTAYPQSSVEFVFPDGRRMDIELSAVKRHSTTVDDHGAKVLFEGVLLRDVLAMAGIESGEKLRGPALSRHILVVARDGYRVAFSLGELDAEFTNLPVFLADTRDGKRLPPAEGPRRLVVPGDRHGSRGVRQVLRVELREPSR